MNKASKPQITSTPGKTERKNVTVMLDAGSGTQIKIVQSSLNELARAKRITDTKVLNSSAIESLIRVTNVANGLKLDTPVIDSISSIGKAFEGLKINSSIIDLPGGVGEPPQSPVLSIKPTISPGHVRPETRSPDYITANPSGSKAILSPIDFGACLREARKAMGMTQQQFADAAGVGRRFVSECESGKPRLEFGKVIQVASAAGIDLLARRR